MRLSNLLAQILCQNITVISSCCSALCYLYMYDSVVLHRDCTIYLFPFILPLRCEIYLLLIIESASRPTTGVFIDCDDDDVSSAQVDPLFTHLSQQLVQVYSLTVMMTVCLVPR